MASWTSPSSTTTSRRAACWWTTPARPPRSSTGLVLDVYKDKNGSINDVSFNGGAWSDLWSEQHDAHVDSWNEFDWWVGMNVTFAQNWTFGVQYIEFIPPAADLSTSFPAIEHNMEFSLAYDDTGWGWPIPIHPYVKLFYELQGPSTVVFGTSGQTYDVEIGIVPTYDAKKATGMPLVFTAPTWITVGPTSYWNKNDGTTERMRNLVDVALRAQQRRRRHHRLAGQAGARRDRAEAAGQLVCEGGRPLLPHHQRRIAGGAGGSPERPAAQPAWPGPSRTPIATSAWSTPDSASASDATLHGGGCRARLRLRLHGRDSFGFWRRRALRCLTCSRRLQVRGQADAWSEAMRAEDMHVHQEPDRQEGVMTMMEQRRPALWTPGDWNAFFGFGTNILVNMLVLTGLLRFVLKMPDAIVFGRILPALGLMMCLSTFYYAYLAYRLAAKTGRTDVCALPSGISVPHMFIVTFVIMLPIALKTGDPIKGWEAGLIWVFFQSFMLMIGGFIAPYIRKITPRAALLGTLAGVSITFIAMRPALEMYMTPVIGLTCFAIILVSWFGGFKYPKGIPAGLVAIAVGTLIAWGSNVLGLGYGGLSVAGVTGAFTNFGFSLPLPAVDHVFSGFEFLGVILVTAIPFGIYDLVEAMDNVESAEAAGDPYPTTRVLTADGVVSLIGCLMGNPFINAVYIGHPGWKSMGGRIGYSAATGLMVIVLAWFGVISLLLAVIPVVAISPILLYIGMLIGAQAFQTTPTTHAPAIVLALTPHLAGWCKTLMDGALGAAGTSAGAVGFDKLGNVGRALPWARRSSAAAPS